MAWNNFSIFGWWSWKNLLPEAQFRYENKIYRLLSMSIEGHSKLIVCFCQNENVHMMTFIKNIKYWLSKFFPFNTLPFVAFYIFLVRFPFSFNVTSKIALELKFYCRTSRKNFKFMSMLNLSKFKLIAINVMRLRIEIKFCVWKGVFYTKLSVWSFWSLIKWKNLKTSQNFFYGINWAENWKEIL